MLRQNTNALGIIFPNSYDNTVPELVTSSEGLFGAAPLEENVRSVFS